MRIHSNLSIVLISILSFKVNGSAVPQPPPEITIHQFETILAELIIDSEKNSHDFGNALQMQLSAFEISSLTRLVPLGEEFGNFRNSGMMLSKFTK